MGNGSDNILVAGCGDAFSTDGNHHACYRINLDEKVLFLDFGATALTSLKRLKVDLQDVDIIIISHFHGDHYSGLPFYFLDAAILQKRKKKLHLVSPPGLKQKLRELTSLLYPGSEKVLDSFPVEYHVLKADEHILVDGFKIYSVKVKHAKATLPHGLRIEGKDKIVAYSGDTGWTDNLIKIAQDADVFICECNNYDTKMSSHLDYKSFVENKNKLKAREIYLSHLGPEMIEAIKEGRIKEAKPVHGGLKISL